jgi:hypothetical protein
MRRWVAWGLIAVVAAVLAVWTTNPLTPDKQWVVWLRDPSTGNWIVWHRYADYRLCLREEWLHSKWVLCAHRDDPKPTPDLQLVRDIGNETFLMFPVVHWVKPPADEVAPTR